MSHSFEQFLEKNGPIRASSVQRAIFPISVVDHKLCHCACLNPYNDLYCDINVQSNLKMCVAVLKIIYWNRF